MLIRDSAVPGPPRVDALKLGPCEDCGKPTDRYDDPVFGPFVCHDCILKALAEHG